MKWRVLLELTEANGNVETRELVTGHRPMNAMSPAAIGLTLVEGKSVLAAMQTELVQAQADGYCEHRRTCSHCGSRRAVKDWRSRQLMTLFGAVQVEAPRFNPCRCGVASRRIVSPLVEMMPDRCTPEYERVLTRMGSMAAYGRAAALMAEFLPLDKAPAIETTRRRTIRVGARLEQQVLMAKPLAFPSIRSVDRSVGRRRPCKVDQKLSDAIVRGHVGLREQRPRGAAAVQQRPGRGGSSASAAQRRPARARRNARDPGDGVERRSRRPTLSG